MIPFTTPDGQHGEATEYFYEVTAANWMGETQTMHLYAWSTPVLEPWTHSDGSTKVWDCPVPEARLVEMGIHDFDARHESEMHDVQILK